MENYYMFSVSGVDSTVLITADLHMFLCVNVFVICFMYMWIRILVLHSCMCVCIPILCAYRFLPYTYAQYAWLGTFLIHEHAHFHFILCAFM